jgi:hypothetical protein
MLIQSSFAHYPYALADILIPWKIKNHNSNQITVIIDEVKFGLTLISLLQSANLVTPNYT